MTTSKRKNIYSKLYFGYFVASLITIGFSVVFLIKNYFLHLQAMTLADIFLILVLLFFSLYFRMNALHYQSILQNQDRFLLREDGKNR